MTREEAIEIIRRCCPRVGDSQCDFETALRELIPELCESEDERIRKEIISALKFANDGGVYDKHIAYLEKQKEQKPSIFPPGLGEVRWNPISSVQQKPAERNNATINSEPIPTENQSVDIPLAEWSEEDEKHINSIFNDFKQNVIPDEEDQEWLENRFKSLRPQPKQEWSEEDEKRIQRICDFLWKNRKGDTDTIYQIEKDADWLKSLRPQSKQEWSEEDEKILNAIISVLMEIKSQPLKRLEDWDGYIRFLKSLSPQCRHSKEQMKNFPKWKKADRDWDAGTIDFAVFHKNDGGDHEDWFSVEVTNRLYKGEYYIELFDLDKLPKEE